MDIDQSKRLAALQDQQRGLRQFEADEARAIAGAIEELNKQGYVVLDGHIHNFSVVRDADGVKVAFLDPGGIVEAAGRSPDVARAAQSQVLIRPADDIDFAQRFGRNPSTYGDFRTELAAELGNKIDYGAFNSPAPINADTINFRPSLGYEHPEVVEAFKLLTGG